MTWETVIGLEIHAQLATRSKIFSAASTAFGAEPNTQASAVDLGLPGVLPVVNREVVRMAVRFALATGASITKRSVFARKNYFYPDLPKGYQISQMAFPIVGEGSISVTLPDGEVKVVGLTRAHLEEDAGKSVHDLFEGNTAIDLNRAGTPLLEIVSEPDMRSATEAVAYARFMHSLVRYIEICDGNMQEGSFRCDANVSIRQKGSETLGTRTEIKNLNSFRFLERAIDFEVERQIDILESGGKITQETRLYDADRDETRSMRSKEEANDYRYFPDPDLPPLVIDDAFIESVRSTMPELPTARRARFVETLDIPAIDAQALCADRQTADYFEAVFAGQSFAPRLAANWVLGELYGRMNKEDVVLADVPVSAAGLGTLIARVDDGTLSGKLGKQVFDAMWSGEQDVDAIIEARGLKQISDTGAIEAMIDEVMAANPSQLEEYRAGKEKLLSFFVGAVMKASRGKANPAQLNQMLREKLKP
ncbi:Asp-tRNA(Asn)/Glu-tRNA(Gln) amidotransferase subunit GatB [Granulosicoccus antarcticus]|uniref:Aspartyl/glutamyl-tRNA(Asn/Gln) amidotransferase subunit B n=1 Tax=Granulosicoccus antarcticus IMCC3135 TaxID=1192854 RepID=A0A2Z2NM20_9GAMM|nr:Asp-tRNA(Asn)/Glu-tRNA(Gln) amidotransferase subunit GatB [Granulosicoccus antarcticus]ASJ72219.1 Aspartyl/glutamyl-tRNA(Asn/Gln) amidotransferase subunit B [Granulosicoccus antarcticus IMCC3135]